MHSPIRSLRFKISVLLLAAWAANAVAATDEGFWVVKMRDGREAVGQLTVGQSAGTLELTTRSQKLVIASTEICGLRRATEREVVLATETPGRGLMGCFFAGPNLQDILFFREDVGGSFGGTAAMLGVDVVNGPVSAEWRGSLLPPVSGRYRIYVKSNDAAFVCIGGIGIGNRWRGETTDLQGEVTLEQGKAVPILIQRRNVGIDSKFRMEWEAAGLPRQEVPADVLQPDLAGYRRVGWLAEFEQGAGKVDRVLLRESGADWGEIPPREGLGKKWKARLSGEVMAPVAGRYELQIRSSGDFTVRWRGEQIKVGDMGIWPLELDPASPGLLEVDLAAHGSGHEYLRMFWKRPGCEDGQPIPVTAIRLPKTMPDLAGMVINRATLPEKVNRGQLGNPEVEGQVDAPAGQLIEWLADGRLIAFSGRHDQGRTKMPFASLPPGPVRLSLRTGGLETAPLPLQVDGLPGNDLYGPWEDFRIGSVQSRVSVKRLSGSTLFECDGPAEVMTEEDSMRLIGQRLSGDGEIRGRLTVTSAPEAGATVGGLMLRDQLMGSTRFVAVVLTSGGESHVLLRRDRWRATDVIPVSLAPGQPVRLVRDGGMVRVLVSDDEGQSWRAIWTDSFSFSETCFAGVFSADRRGASKIEVKDLSVILRGVTLPRPLGIVLKSGTFLTGTLERSDDGTMFRVNHRGNVVGIHRDLVARLYTAEMSSVQEELLTPKTPATLLRSIGDDIIAGQPIKVSPDGVETSSELFGPRLIPASEVRAVAFQPIADSAKGAICVITADGSRLLGKALDVNQLGITVDDATIPGGIVRWSLSDVVRVELFSGQSSAFPAR